MSIATVADLKASRIPPSLGLCPTDPRLLQYFNEWEEDALNHGRWHGSVVRAQFCTYGGLVAWPRQVASVEQVTLHGRTIMGHNIWYSFMSPVSQPTACGACGGQGTSTGCSSCGSLNWTSGTNQPVFKQLTAARMIKLYPRSSTDVGKIVLLQGDDQNGAWVRKSYGGIFIDGERVVIGSTFGISTTKFRHLVGAQKEQTDERVLVYSYDPATAAEEQIGEWQPTETAPSYATSMLPNTGRNCPGNVCRSGTIQALVKLRHVDVALDSDWLILQNEVAAKHGMKARQLYEQNMSTAANEQMVLSINALNHELRTYTSDRVEGWVDLGMESFRGDLTNFR